MDARPRGSQTRVGKPSGVAAGGRGSGLCPLTAAAGSREGCGLGLRGEAYLPEVRGVRWTDGLSAVEGASGSLGLLSERTGRGRSQREGRSVGLCFQGKVNSRGQTGLKKTKLFGNDCTK